MGGFANAWNGTIVIVYVGKIGGLGGSGFTLDRRGRFGFWSWFCLPLSTMATFMAMAVSRYTCSDGKDHFRRGKPGLDSRERRLSSALRLLSLLRQSVKKDIPTQVVRPCEEREKGRSSLQASAKLITIMHA